MNYYPFHLGDYALHTSHLDPIEDITYRRMLDLYYRDQVPLPSDAQRIAKLIRMPDHAGTVRDILNEFFTESPEGYRNARADREIEAYKRMSDGGVKGAAKRWAKGSDALPIAPLSPPHSNPNSNQNQNQNQNQEPKENTPRKTRASAVADCVSVDDLVLEGVDEQHAKDWFKCRKDKGAKTLTKTAWQTVKDESVKAGMTPAIAVKTAAGNNWQGFKASWLTEGDSRHGPPSKTGGDIGVAATNALHETQALIRQQEEHAQKAQAAMKAKMQEHGVTSIKELIPILAKERQQA